MRVPGAAHFVNAARATHAVYGSIVVLAVVTGLDEASATAREAVVAIVGAAAAVGLAEIYADVIGTTFRERRAPTHAEWTEFAIDVAFGFGTALLPAAFFLLALADVLGLRDAFTIAEWSGVAVLWVYVFAAGRTAGLGLPHSLVWAIGLTVCGVGLVELKNLAGTH
jgi:hypothetical protein